MEITHKNTQESPVNSFSVLLKAEDVAHRLKICRSEAYHLMQEGKIPTVRFNRIVRVREVDLEEFITKSLSGWQKA
jgi:excisionase family DNA binding protein